MFRAGLTAGILDTLVFAWFLESESVNRNGASNGPDSFVGHGPCNGHCVDDDDDGRDEITKFCFMLMVIEWWSEDISGGVYLEWDGIF